MHRVAEQGHPAPGPFAERHLLDVGGDDAVHRAQLRKNARDALVGELPERVAEPAYAVEHRRLRLRRVERGPDVEPRRRDRHQPDALAPAQELGEMPHAGFIVDDQPVRTVPHVARPDLAEEPAPHLGMDAVGADQEIRLEDLAAPGFRAYSIWLDVDLRDAAVEPSCRGRKAATQL